MTVRININSPALNDLAMENEVVNRRRIGAFYKNIFERNLNFLRIAHENLLSSESVIREANTATKIANFTRNQIQIDSRVAILS